jgi:hypothetical protein
MSHSPAELESRISAVIPFVTFASLLKFGSWMVP